ncbi:TlpA family protein disulfide reductase [Paludisphaera borealis]|uniref:Thiol-disulfide oxidoreductase ResA n=1 Tax=Paludisphaera borealis TaxID=1387353 RepID=A0A1U7CX23_9BACT|nr:TlpA disulfide reductase family protein [Paludisphaera borealis]APW63439.1 Thiol-disulfide oxidoreductase ResA [Paludisphaera borealis]
MKRLLSVLAVVATSAVAQAGTIDGVWEAKSSIGEVDVPFKVEFSGEGENFKGTLFDGDVPVHSTSGKLEGDTFVLKFDHFLGKLKGTIKDGRIEGAYSNAGREGGYVHEFSAVRPSNKPVVAAKDVPSIDGQWEIPHESAKGEKAWRLIIHQKGDEAAATILRIDGDTGGLKGRYQDGKFILSLFAGSKVLRLDLVPTKDGTLDLTLHSTYAKFLTKSGETDKTYLKYVAYRPADARAKGLPEPTDPLKHTTVRNASERFKFQFPDVDGKVYSSEDAKFKGKVVVAVVTGTWCPNCHDEAQYLVELHKKYRDQGLEVVALDFEENEQQEQNYKRVRAFVKHYGVEYPYLIAGAPLEMWTKVPQAVNLNTWPATFFIGRDGLVKQIHAGFASPASAELNTELKKEFTETIEKLLSENSTASR